MSIMVIYNNNLKRCIKNLKIVCTVFSSERADYQSTNKKLASVYS